MAYLNVRMCLRHFDENSVSFVFHSLRISPIQIIIIYSSLQIRFTSTNNKCFTQLNEPNYDFKYVLSLNGVSGIRIPNPGFFGFPASYTLQKMLKKLEIFEFRADSSEVVSAEMELDGE